MSPFRWRSRRGPPDAPTGEKPALLTRADERAERGVRALDDMFASAPADEARAWARFEAQRKRRQSRARSWLRGAGVVAAASAVGVSAFVVWKGGRMPGPRVEPPASGPAMVSTAAAPAPTVRPVPSAPPPEPRSPPSERPAPAPLAAGASVLSPGVRARLSRGGRATYFPATTAQGYVVLENGTLELDGRVPAGRAADGLADNGHDGHDRHDARAADRPLEVRVSDWQVRGGGRFKVVAHGRRVDVVVEQGSVTVAAWSPMRMVARVVAGERWTSASAATLAVPAVPAAPAAESRDCLRLARDGVTSDAIACLEEQSAEAGLAGEVALLELARIRRDVKDDLAGAERLLADHERRFPHSGLATEARSARIELLLRLGRPADALAEAQRLGGSEAIYWRAVSLAALGRRDEAKDAFAEYLGRPDIQRRREATRKQSELAP